MTALKFIIIGFQIVLALILIAVVLLQSGSQRGLSGSIAGGAETFFGKNKGRSLDAKLKKWTSVVAVLFLISSISLNLVIQAEDKKIEAETQALIEEQAKAQEKNEENHVHEEGEEGEEGENTPVEEETAE